MKKMTRFLLFAALLLTACGPTADRIMKKYEGHKPVDPSENRLGFRFFQQQPDALGFFFANTSDYLKEPKENYRDVRENMRDILSERFVVLDANDPAKPLAFEVAASHGGPEYTDAVEVTLRLAEKSRFILVGFRGVRESESAQWKTPALFYLFEDGEQGLQLLTSDPLLAGDLVPMDFPEAQFLQPQPLVPDIGSEYEGRVALGGGKTLAVSFSLSDKGGQRTITECKIAVETSVRNSDGSNRVTANNHFGYGIQVQPDGSFNHAVSDFTVSGKVGKDRITGSIKGGGVNNSFSAKETTGKLGNTNVYKSMESATVR